MAVQDKVDVVTVGAGWTAAILAAKLCPTGVKVRSLEQGNERWTATDFQHNHDALRHMVRKALMIDLGKETWTWRPNPGMPSLPFRQLQSFHPGSGLGGAGIHWAAETWRFHPSDFVYRSHHIERYGEDRLPEGSTIQDWPLTYEELEPFYDEVEFDIGISGQTGNLGGQILPGGNPFEGQRSRPFPLPPLVSSVAAMRFDEAARGLGYQPFPQPTAILSEAYTGLSGRPRSGCLYCGFCVRYGCEVDAKASAITDHTWVALETGNYDIRYGAKVTGIMVGDDGLATGLRYVDMATGEEHEQPADTVVLSGYTLTNVRLLLMSQSVAHPDGVGNDQGMVGKNYTYQLLGSPAVGVFDGLRLNSYMGHAGVKRLIDEFNGDNFDHTDLDFLGGASISCGDGAREPITSVMGLIPFDQDTFGDVEDLSADFGIGPALPTERSDLGGHGVEWGASWKQNLARNWDSQTGVSIQGESLPYEDQFLDLDPVYKDAWGQPLLRITYDFHENDRRLYKYVAARCIEIMEAMEPTRMSTTPELESYNTWTYQSTHCTGGAIMGSDPATSVTNRYGQVWDTPNVFVTGAALYPQNPGFNPTGTLLALAYLTGDALVREGLERPDQLIDS